MRALFMLLAIVAVITSGAIPAAAHQSPAKSTAKPAAASAKPAGTATAPVNINTATQAQLESLPGIGVKAAERILEYVKGIGEKSFLKLKPLLTVSDKAAPSGGSDR